MSAGGFAFAGGALPGNGSEGAAGTFGDAPAEFGGGVAGSPDVVAGADCWARELVCRTLDDDERRALDDVVLLAGGVPGRADGVDCSVVPLVLVPEPLAA